MGSATLWHLAERGVRAVGFERFEPGHDRGSSHGQSRIFRTAYLEGASYVPLALRAVELWQELQRVSDADLMIPTGVLMLGPRDSAVVTGTMNSIRVHDLPHQMLGEDEIRARYPAHRVEPGDVGIFEERAGLLYPERAIRAAARRAETLGATIVRGATVDRIETGPWGVRVAAGEVRCEARHAVVSVGSWLPRFLPALRLPLRVTRQVITWFPVDRPEAFDPDRFPVFARDIGGDEAAGATTSDSSFYGFPTLDGRTVKLAIHREGRTADPDDLDRSVTSEDLAPVQAYIRRFLEGVGTDAVRAQVCMYTNTPDHDFLIGSPPDLPNVTILGGFSGHGFKFASVVGEILADLADRGATELPIGRFRVGRFGGSGGVGQPAR
ncbi:MAG: N-methyl-L-tryptophan oxidase [Chloroflexi bacterium]|nr:N-methyl-L-tryptophan oxidase [Chloroflexota bacterium]